MTRTPTNLRYLDYSAGKISGQTIKNAGYQGVIRYIDSPDRWGTKHTNVAEYNSHIAAGLNVYLVMEVGTGDCDGGHSRGVSYAQRAKAGADNLGYTGPIFFCNDRPDLPNSANWKLYLDGAASVLGAGRIGAYGFGNALDAAVGHANYFWQAGRESELRNQTHIYQWNNGSVTVGGIECDLNKVYTPISPVAPVNNYVPSQTSTIPLEEAMTDIPAGNGVQTRLFTAGRPHFLWIQVSGQGKSCTVKDIAYIKRTPGHAGGDYGALGQPGYPDLRGWLFEADRPGPIAFADDVAWIWLMTDSADPFSVAIG